MAKTLLFKTNVHLSPNFGGIETGDKAMEIKKGSNVEIKNNELAQLLIDRGHASEIQIDSQPKKTKGAKADDAGAN